MSNKTKLELTWIGKDQRPRLEPRVLVEDPSKSYHAPERVTDHDHFDNRLIFGDNLLALKALEQEFTGKIKCVFIDPPYNTGSAFAQYDDGIEHSLWLSLMRDRLEMLRKLLREDGSIWITIDDNECHYLKVLCDELFGRANFIANVIWEKSDSPRMDAQFFSNRHDHMLIFAKDKSSFVVNKEALDTDSLPAHYDRTDSQGRPYYLKPLRAMGGDDTREARPTLYFPMIAPDGTEVLPVRQDGSQGRWRWGKERTEADVHLIEWVNGRNGSTPYYRIYGDTQTSFRPPETIWTHSQVGSNRTSKSEIRALFGGTKSFDTPKPEALLKRIVEIATHSGDWVLDSFGGSGTTGAVAHKMGRKWIMVELGEHCESVITPRLKKVIDAHDLGGVTEATNWKGGGGFRYFSIAPSLLQQDSFGNWIINKQYNAELLAQAVCKIEGFQYAPSESMYWQQGQSSEHDFIYVTTQTLSRQQIEALAEEVGPSRSLVIYCHAFRVKNLDEFPNLTLKKIPKTVIEKCEWGKDDYSLEIKALQPVAPEPEGTPPPPRRKPKRVSSQPKLPGMEGDE